MSDMLQATCQKILLCIEGFAQELWLSISWSSDKIGVLAGQRAIGEAADEAASYRRLSGSLSQSVRILAYQIGRRAALIHISKGTMQRLRYADKSYNVNQKDMICALHLVQLNNTNINHGPRCDRQCKCLSYQRAELQWY